jgi:hypothetical protein
MGGAKTVLSSIKEGDLWRVEIVWPNGTKRHVGKFDSEQEAEEWISTHRWLTDRGMEGTEIYRPWGSVSRRRSWLKLRSGKLRLASWQPNNKKKTDPTSSRSGRPYAPSLPAAPVCQNWPMGFAAGTMILVRL